MSAKNTETPNETMSARMWWGLLALFCLGWWLAELWRLFR